MDRGKFISLLSTTKTDIDEQWIVGVLKRSIDSNLDDGNSRGYRNLIIAMEELSELNVEVSKELRGKGDKYHILEELADAQLSIYYIQEICGISDDDLHKALNIKTCRLEEKLEERESITRERNLSK